MMNLIVEVLISAVLVFGGIFALIGSIGLFRLKLPMQRLHAPSKAITVAVSSTLVASAVGGYWQGGAASWHEILVAFFLFITAPITTLYLAKTHLFSRIALSDLPPAAHGSTWATYDLGLEEPPK